MAAQIIEIADAVVSVINAASLTPAFTAVRKYQPRFTLEELETLRVCVVPKENLETAAARRLQNKDIQIDIGVQKKTEGADSEYDELMLLVEEIGDLFFELRLAAPADAVWKQTANEPIWSVDDMEQEQVFIGVITVTFSRMNKVPL